MLEVGMRRLLRGLAISACLVTVVGFTGTPAHAQGENAPTGAGSIARDPGNCGVRVGMEMAPGKTIYIMRNKCATAYNFAVYLPVVRRYADPRCQRVVTNEIETFSSVIVDANWRIELC